jgi:hypothetical protein
MLGFFELNLIDEVFVAFIIVGKARTRGQEEARRFRCYERQRAKT